MATQRLRSYGHGDMMIRASQEGGRTIEGYAILFNSLSLMMGTYGGRRAYEIIDPAAVPQELLDSSTIVMSLNHDDRMMLAKSRDGKGTLSYEIDEHGVKFRFDAPNTVDGDKALELVKRGDLDGCSFAFSTHYGEPDVTRELAEVDGEEVTVFRVKRMSAIYDFTLTPTPAYPETEVSARSISEAPEIREEPKQPEMTSEAKAQIEEMRKSANAKL